MVASEGSRLVVQTDLEAERGRLLAVDLEQLAADGSPGWVGGGARARGDAAHGRPRSGDGFVAVYLADASPEVRRFDRAGRDLGIVAGQRRCRWSGCTGEPGPTRVLRRAVVGHQPDPELPDRHGDRRGHRPARAGARGRGRLRAASGDGRTARGDQRGRHPGALLPGHPGGRRPVGAAAHAALGLRRVQGPDPGRLPLRLVRLAGRGRSAGARQPARRWGVRQRVARRRAAGPQAERVRRLRRRRRAPDGVRGHDAEPAGAARSQQRWAAGRRGHHPAAGSGRGGPAGRRRAGHAAVLPVHHRRGLDLRLRRPGRPRAVRRCCGPTRRCTTWCRARRTRPPWC